MISKLQSRAGAPCAECVHYFALRWSFYNSPEARAIKSGVDLQASWSIPPSWDVIQNPEADRVRKIYPVLSAKHLPRFVLARVHVIDLHHPQGNASRETYSCSTFCVKPVWWIFRHKPSHSFCGPFEKDLRPYLRTFLGVDLSFGVMSPWKALPEGVTNT